jgi:mono/diheme cytochrome c family protein
MWRFVAGAVVGAVVAVLLGVALLVRGGLSARAEPGAAEAAIARRVRSWAMPSSARSVANPVPRTAETLADARAHFADHCASCHANDGSGATELGRSLYPRAPDLRAAATQELADGELFWIIEHGVRFTGMPAWGGAGNPAESWKLVHFVRHLPKLGEEERREMEAMNPRSPDEWREQQEDEAFLRGGEAPAPSRQGRDGKHAH